MTKYSKFNFVYRLQKWMDSVPGQTFLNYAYSWGAAIVILGTLFKLTHIPGANFWLFLGMGTEVVVFFLSAFDRPFDKTADGMELPTHLNLNETDTENEGDETGNVAVQPAVAGGKPSVGGAGVQGGVAGGGTIIIGGGGSRQGGVAASEGGQPAVAAAMAGGNAGGIVSIGGGQAGGSGAAVVEQPAAIPPFTPDMTEATNAYVDELKKLTEVLERVSEQSRRLTTDSEEMENLNRTLTGICKVYEMQLKSASSQIGTIDEINEQTKKMAQQIEQLNNIYARMIEAMTMKMKVE